MSVRLALALLGLLLTVPAVSTIAFYSVAPSQYADQIRYKLGDEIDHRATHIVIVPISSETLRAIPDVLTNRRALAAAAEKLSKAGSTVIAYDLFFSEERADDNIYSRELARHIGATRNVVLAARPLELAIGPSAFESLSSVNPVIGIAAFDKNRKSDIKGAISFYAYGYDEKSKQTPSFPVSIACLANGWGEGDKCLNKLFQNLSPNCGHPFKLPVYECDILIEYIGGETKFITVPFEDLVADSSLDLTNKTVIVGVTASEIDDSVPLESTFSSNGKISGVIYIANAVYSLLRQELRVAALPVTNYALALIAAAIYLAAVKLTGRVVMPFAVIGVAWITVSEMLLLQVSFFTPLFPPLMALAILAALFRLIPSLLVGASRISPK